jgi:hypothetical protein
MIITYVFTCKKERAKVKKDLNSGNEPVVADAVVLGLLFDIAEAD